MEQCNENVSIRHRGTENTENASVGGHAPDGDVACPDDLAFHFSVNAVSLW